MYYLVAVILLNTFIFTAFKLYGRFGVNTLQAVSINYWVCSITGILTHGYLPFSTTTTSEPWFVSALLLGTYFMFLFSFMAYSTRTQGMTITTIANKLSLVITVAFSYWLYSEPMGWLKFAGITLAIPAVYMATKREQGMPVNNMLVPIGIFIFSGLSDTGIKYIQHYQLHNEGMQSAFTITTFLVAAIAGTIVVLFSLLTGKSRLELKNVIGGIALGIPNYFSIYYLIRLLDSDLMSSSSIIPVNNVGIVITTSLVAILVFKEAAGWRRMAGVLLAIIAIALIAWSGN